MMEDKLLFTCITAIDVFLRHEKCADLFWLLPNIAYSRPHLDKTYNRSSPEEH